MRPLLCLFIALACVPQVSFAGPTVIDTLISDTVASWFGGRIIPVGDQNGDGYDDFLTEELLAKLYLCLGGPPETGIQRLKVDDSSYSLLSNLGFINGDSIPDFGAIRKTSTGRERLAVWYGGLPLSDGPDLLFGDDTQWPGQAFPTAGDNVTGSGLRELITGHYDNLFFPSLLFFKVSLDPDSLLDFQLWAPPHAGYPVFGSSVISGDFNGDGSGDIVTNMLHSGPDSINGQVFVYWGGPLFDTIPDAHIVRSADYSPPYTTFGMRIEFLNDVNGDGWDDFYVGYSDEGSADSCSWVFFGGPAFDTIPDVTICDWAWRARPAGDINHDGYNDLIKGRTSPFSGLGYANIYLGGPDFDSIPDLIIDHSIFSGYYTYFAHEVAGLGDVNGDGIDDFAIASSQGSGFPWVIFIFAGWGDPVSVDDDPSDPTLPTAFTLEQNFPNPFNPSTTIAFSLPTRSRVAVNVYNSIGEHVNTLVGRELPAGGHRVTWDGTDGRGRAVSSGVYFYRLKANGVELSRKMLLLK